MGASEPPWGSLHFVPLAYFRTHLAASEPLLKASKNFFVTHV